MAHLRCVRSSRGDGREMVRLASTIFSLVFSTVVHASCIDVSEETTIEVSGELSRPTFAGSPNFEDVRKGDTPEPAYILTLGTPFCIVGDDFVPDDTVVERIHLTDGFDVLLPLVGQTIRVVGTDPVGAYTSHHHAPLLMGLISARPDLEQDGRSAAKTTVEAFYLALEVGDGMAATRNVIPEKRSNGPLSAQALSGFYGNLKRPLKLAEVTPLGKNRFRARYHFENHDGGVCDGSSVITTRQLGSLNLISGIRAESGC